MLIEETFYAIECDVCKAQAENEEGHTFWADETTSKENAKESEWHEEEDKHYCPKCHSFDDEDNLVKVLPTLAEGAE